MTEELTIIGILYLLNETDDYKGYIFPKGSLVVLIHNPIFYLVTCSVRLMLRDSRVYADMDKFTPDRFLATEGHARRRTLAKLAYLDLGDCEPKHGVGRERRY